MSVSYNASGKSTWQTGQTTRTATVNCSGTYRYAVAVAMSFGALPTSVKYDGVDMTLLDSWSGETGSGFYIALYGLAQPNTGSKSVVATWGSSQECFLGVSVGSSSSAAITLKDTGKGSGHSTYPAMSATADSATGDLALGACFQYDTDEYGEGYAPAVTAGTITTFTSTVGPSSNGGGIGGYKAGGSSSTTLDFVSDASGTLDWVAVLATITDAGGGGGSTDLTVANSSTGHSSDNLALTQVHNITVADTSTSHASENVVLTLGGVDLSIADTSTDHTSENVVLVEIPTLVVADTATGHASENLDLTQDHTLAIANTSTSHASQNITLDGVSPIGDLTFDCAAGHNALAIRGIAYDGGDETSSGFKLQYNTSTDGGDNWDGWTDFDDDYQYYLEDTPQGIGGSWSAGDVITVKLRAVNDSGNGDETAPQSYKLHETWHRTGARRYNPSTTVGFAAAGYDVTTVSTMSGPLTTGGTDRLVLAFHDTAYGEPVSDPDTYLHDFSYAGDAAVKHRTYFDPSGRRGPYAGGDELFYLTNPDTGQNTGQFTWTNPTSGQRSTWMVVTALELIEQNSPIAATKMRMATGAQSNSAYPGISDGYQQDATYDNYDDSQYMSLHVRDVPASYDELILSFNGTYGQSDYTGATDQNEFGEAGTTGASWSSQTSSGPRNVVKTPYDSNLVPYAGCGAGAEDYVRAAAYLPGTIPSDMPLHIQRWKESVEEGWGAIMAVVLRPSPNMISSLSVTSASTGSINWQCTTKCNHSSVMLAVYDDADPDPTAQQLWDEIYGAGSDYSGTLLIVDEHALTNGDVSATGGTISDSLAGLAFGDYKLAAAYVNWQGQVNPTNNLGDVLVDSFSITDVDLAIANTSTGHTSENLDLTQVSILAIDSTSTAHASDNLDLTQDHTLAIDGSSTGNLSPNVTLGVPSEGGGGGGTIGFISNIIRPIIDR